MPCQWEPYGLIGDEWRRLGAEGRFGCPSGPNEYDIHDEFGNFKGRRRDFSAGQMAWSPGQGPNLVVTLSRDGGRLHFSWWQTLPFKYDNFIVRWSLSAGDPVTPNAQETIPGGSEISGDFWVEYPGHLPVGPDGKRVGVEFIVEGYDDDGHSRQGWTCPLRYRM
jgi:hypothetical protein